MKKSILLALLILGIGAIPRLLELQRKPTAAVRQGAPAESPSAKREREDRNGEALAAATEWIGYFKERENFARSGARPDAGFEDRYAGLPERLDELDFSQLKTIIAEVGKNRELSADSQRAIISAALTRIAPEHPEAVLALFLESGALLGKREAGRDVMATALAGLATRDPDAAAGWIRKNAAAYAATGDDEVNRDVISAVAESDPQLAFDLLGELEFDDPAETLESMVEAAAVAPENKAELLAALRGHLGKLPEEARAEVRDQALGAIARNPGGKNVDEMTRWIAESEFTKEEAASFAAGLSANTTKADTGRWIDWIAATFPAADLIDPVSNLVGEWTSQDYQAAGKWLAGTSDGPARNAAVLAYAATVAEYEPRIAGQWAATLPPGRLREEALRRVYRNWPGDDPEGAAGFAREHGMD